MERQELKKLLFLLRYSKKCKVSYFRVLFAQNFPQKSEFRHFLASTSPRMNEKTNTGKILGPIR